ncbi:ABC transporter permease [Clostridium sp. 'deep sea']|uniref:ABC transporter permease n=1 Tax=Clostridium sp. 'deep sea' TaxID=2779445 RepID=UPI00189671FD|nr:ABC transporter permease [Clostridium sp. 'deep sea']QOR34551.1 ABC transporter permease [Clostridium sp. 'deep sea']
MSNNTIPEYKIDKSDFKLVERKNEIKDDKMQGKAIGFFRDALQRFIKNKASIIAFCVISFIVLMSLIGPSMNAYTFRQQNVEWSYLPPKIKMLEKTPWFNGYANKEILKSNMETKYKGSIVKVIKEYTKKNKEMATVQLDMYKYKGAEGKYFWFGTDSLGRDQWTRLWRGARISFIIALLAVSVNMCIGVTYGSISGYFGGTIDLFMQRFIEILNGIPRIVIVVLFVFYVGPGIVPIALSFVIKGWIGMSRMIRAQFFRYKNMEYVLASRTMGASNKLLIFRHILPNAIGPIITKTTLAIPGAIFSEAFLAYIGLGLQAPEPSIGVLLAAGQEVLLEYPFMTIYPAILISLLMVSFNLFGNGLRDAFDPTLRGVE